MLKPGGVLLISVPAFPSLWSEVDAASGHLRRYVKADFSKFASLPLELKYSTYFFASVLPLFMLHRRATAGRHEPDKDLEISRVPNMVLGLVTRLECLLIPHVTLPFGSSLFAVFRKPLN